MNQCMYEPITGSFPHCGGACKKGKDNYCPYYYVDEIYEILSSWKSEAKVDDPLLISYDYKKKKLIIYTTKPGYLIGLHGKIIKKYSETLNEKLRSRFTDVSGVPQDDDFIELVECKETID